jgi:putative membrane protein
MQKGDLNFKTFGKDFVEFWRLLFVDMKDWKKWLRQVLYGIFLGAAVIGPGISGSALAVTFGIYDEVIGIIANPFKKFWANIRFLAPLGVGGVLGIGLLALLLNHLFSSTTSETLVTYLFIGLMLGSIPALVREANEQGSKKWYVALAAVVLAGVTALGLWIKASQDGDFSLPMNFWTAVLGGVVIGLVSLAPGLSVSFVLIFLGLYAPLMAAVTGFDWLVIAGVALGALVAVVAFAKLVKMLSSKFYGQTYYVFIGLALAAMILIFPSLPGGIYSVVAILMLLGGMVGGYFLNKLGDK